MPRHPGQVDEAKTEAILEASAALFAERGLAASMDEIARRAGVSRQTLYNRFASKSEIAQALAEQRSAAVTAPLKGGGEPEAVLEALALSLLERVCAPEKTASLRGVCLVSADAPEISRIVYQAGPGESLKRLSAWLADQTRAGRLDTPDPDEAAEMFTGMVLGHGHLRAVLDIPQIGPEQRKIRAREAAARFVRAFAPVDAGERSA